jgi:hypothetical protein
MTIITESKLPFYYHCLQLLAYPLQIFLIDKEEHQEVFIMHTISSVLQ